MKVIDLLNKINKGEEIPKKVKYEDTIFAYDKDRKEYIYELDDWCSETILFKITNEHTHFIQDLLKAEVEVIEENKEIEEIDTTKIFEFTMDSVFEWNNEMEDKINELVRAVNKINKEREEK